MNLTARLLDEARRFAFQRSFERRACEHIIGPIPTGVQATCGSCEAASLTWVHLRICTICATVGCCDSSVGRHARRHFEATGHPAIRSIEPGEGWGWCYVDRVYLSARRLEKE